MYAFIYTGNPNGLPLTIAWRLVRLTQCSFLLDMNRPWSEWRTRSPTAAMLFSSFPPSPGTRCCQSELSRWKCTITYYLHSAHTHTYIIAQPLLWTKSGMVPWLIMQALVLIYSIGAHTFHFICSQLTLTFSTLRCYNTYKVAYHNIMLVYY